MITSRRPGLLSAAFFDRWSGAISLPQPVFQSKLVWPQTLFTVVPPILVSPAWQHPTADHRCGRGGLPAPLLQRPCIVLFFRLCSEHIGVWTALAGIHHKFLPWN